MARALLLGLLLLLLPVQLASAQEDEDDWDDDPWAEEAGSGVELHGFVEAAAGLRSADEPAIDGDATLAELRLRLESEWLRDRYRVVARGEALYDGVLEQGSLTFRELALTLSPNPRFDLRLGRQVLTWGTGDLLFLNDLFAKDFESFFAGRSDDYLKAPEEALRLLVYGEGLDVDLVWAPIFEPDNFLDGERFSFFSPDAGAIVAPDPPLRAERPPRTFDNGELSLRLSRSRGGVESALYLHRGFFQQPVARDAEGRPTFAPLQAIGASLRRSAWGGLVNGELVYYDSVDDRSGNDPVLPNSQLRLLVGHERELAGSLTGGFQLYLEWTLDHDALVAASATPQFEVDELRQLLTTRLTYLWRQDRLRLSGFLFFSPSDGDGYLRGELGYRVDDQWSLQVGFNRFEGRDAFTFFGQLDANDNLYVRGRYAF